jgi:beta-1,4-mannosyl-glycoprotein beta-1,4-N-acetylglucosaminyltransferase
MIYDCFTFRDEFDVLELRLKILDSVVDKFVICEADRTFTNQPKPYNFLNQKDRFKQWEDKIIYLPVELDPEGLDFSKKDTEYSPYSAAWMLEMQQRSGLILGLQDAQADDVIMMGDVDEIPNPDSVKHVTTPTVCVMQMFYYYINNRSNGLQDAHWFGTVLVPFKYLADYANLEKVRGQRVFFHKIASGWHLSFMGGKELIKRKIQTISHTEYNSEEYYNDKHIDECLASGKDIFKREGTSFEIVDPKQYYPEHILEIFKSYPSWIYDSKRFNK